MSDNIELPPAIANLVDRAGRSTLANSLVTELAVALKKQVAATQWVFKYLAEGWHDSDAVIMETLAGAGAPPEVLASVGSIQVPD